LLDKKGQAGLFDLFELEFCFKPRTFSTRACWTQREETSLGKPAENMSVKVQMDTVVDNRWTKIPLLLPPLQNL
jgi:hypothetical protein